MKNTYSAKEIIRILQEKKGPMMSPEVNARIRNRVLLSSQSVTENSADRYNTMQDLLFTRLFFKKPMVAILILAIMIAGGTGTAIAANNALPGDALYGIDRALEQAQLHFALRNETKAKLYVNIAAEREDEIEQLQEQNRSDDQDVGEEHEQQALQNAQTVITRVLEEHEEKEQSGKSVEALTNVQQRLNDLSTRFEERHEQNDDNSSSSDDNDDEEGADDDADDNPSDTNSSNGRSQGSDDDRQNNQEENDDASLELEINEGLGSNASSENDD